MTMPDPMTPGERLRRLAALAGLSLTSEEIDRLTPLQEFLMTGLRRLHSPDYGEVEPLVHHRPEWSDEHAGR